MFEIVHIFIKFFGRDSKKLTRAKINNFYGFVYFLWAFMVSLKISLKDIIYQLTVVINGSLNPRPTASLSITPITTLAWC